MKTLAELEKAAQIAQAAAGHDRELENAKIFPSFFAFFHYPKPEAGSDGVVMVEAGTGAILVHRRTGEFYRLGACQIPEACSAAYEACGDLFASNSSVLELTGVNTDFNRNTAILLIKKTFDRTLEEARNTIDKLQTAAPIRLDSGDAWAAKDKLASLQAVGIKGRQLWSNQV